MDDLSAALPRRQRWRGETRWPAAQSEEVRVRRVVAKGPAAVAALLRQRR